jgi:hypothetical protein
MVELFVVGMCVGGIECATVSQAYYSQNKPLQEFVREMETKAQDSVGPTTMQVLVYTLPVAMFMAGQTGVARVSNYFAVEIGRNTNKLLFEFPL